MGIGYIFWDIDDGLPNSSIGYVKDELHILVLEFDYKKQMKLIDRKLVVKLPFMRELSAIISDQSELWFWWNDKNKKSLNSFYDTTAKKADLPGGFQRNE
ncbi:hypothetical protein KY290_002828 [Solanum tuberosum]|uniref:Uncharacterized protein n=1 Tax=Solanum tuberosum TaxID=4113 RepID=A0ABQ7WRN9_SOLTU|nr:hypothetical protein KY290_002828 [Solanum tuberosum]